MTKKPLLSLIIPAYNEAGKIVCTLNESIQYLDSRHIDFEIIVSADGNDGTREIATKLSAEENRICVIGSTERGGKGKGIRNAVALARGRWIGFVDADNKTPITEFDKFLPFLKQGLEVVIGSRGDSHSVIERSQPWSRHI
jgi:dolichyl-phosphate beta-glucosyltransferase